MSYELAHSKTQNSKLKTQNYVKDERRTLPWCHLRSPRRSRDLGCAVTGAPGLGWAVLRTKNSEQRTKSTRRPLFCVLCCLFLFRHPRRFRSGFGTWLLLPPRSDRRLSESWPRPTLSPSSSLPRL